MNNLDYYQVILFLFYLNFSNINWENDETHYFIFFGLGLQYWRHLDFFVLVPFADKVIETWDRLILQIFRTDSLNLSNNFRLHHLKMLVAIMEFIPRQPTFPQKIVCWGYFFAADSRVVGFFYIILTRHPCCFSYLYYIFYFHFSAFQKKNQN